MRSCSCPCSERNEIQSGTPGAPTFMMVHFGWASQHNIHTYCKIDKCAHIVVNFRAGLSPEAAVDKQPGFVPRDHSGAGVSREASEKSQPFILVADEL